MVTSLHSDGSSQSVNDHCGREWIKAVLGVMDVEYFAFFKHTTAHINLVFIFTYLHSAILF